MLSPEQICAALRQLLGAEQVSTGESVRRLHGQDISFHRPRLPDVVVFAGSAADVAATLAFAHRERVPVVPFGAGSSLEGHVLPVRGGISLDMTGLDEIVAIRPRELTATVGAGVTRLQLERALARHGLHLPVDPGANATIGGMAATNAAGTMTFRHGKMRSRVLGLQAVLAGGRIVKTGSRAMKTSAGYDLTGLLVGSEGTLGVITELTVRLEGIPDSVLAARASFPSAQAAALAAQAIVAHGIEARRIELADEWEIAALNRFTGAQLPDMALLIVEVAGAREATGPALAEVIEVFEDHRGREIVQERTPEGQRRLWKMRRDIFEAERLVAPGALPVSTDACVPLDQLGEAIAFTRRALDRWRLTGGIVAHAGDGNVHTGVLVDRDDAEEMNRLRRYLAEITEDALGRDGTCTGEHGIGLGKREALRREHGDQLDLMAGIKRLFDPHLVMNPGKVLADDLLDDLGGDLDTAASAQR